MLKNSVVVVLAGLLTFVFIHGWVSTQFGPTPAELDAARRAHFSEPSPNAVRAVHLYRELPAAARQGLRDYLDRSFVPLDEWIIQLDKRPFQILCVGEDHRASTRRFLAHKFFSQVRVDVLMLEATINELAAINEALAVGESEVLLLEADIAAVLNAAKQRNPKIVVAGIEETSRQREVRQHGRNDGFRDDTIAANFWRNFQAGQRHAALFGALHCADRPAWLFEQLLRTAPAGVATHTHSVRVVGAYQDRVVADLLYFLDQIGFARRQFVIADPRALHPKLAQWLLESLVNRYNAVVVFRDWRPPLRKPLNTSSHPPASSARISPRS